MPFKNFRILSLDGGGTWAAIEVGALKALFGSGSVKGHDVLRAFDLVVSNSGGSIVLGALIADLTLDTILDFFTSLPKIDTVFVPMNVFKNLGASTLHLVGLDIGPKYDTESKLTGLQAVLDPTGGLQVAALSDVIGPNYRNRSVNIVICAFDYDSQRETFFRSDTGSLAASGAAQIDVTLAEAVHASGNAPVNYFDAPAKFSGRRYWDGAIGGYNNPVFAGVIEAVANAQRYGIANNAIAALSIGSGSVALLPHGTTAGNPPDIFVAQHVNSKITTDVVKMAESILDDPPDAASFHTHVMLGGSLSLANGPVTVGPIVRMNPLIQPVKAADGSWTCPSDLTTDQFSALVNLDFDAHTQNSKEDDLALIQDLCKSWLADRSNNQPIRGDANTTQVEIGHGKFSQALAAWKALRDA